MKIAICEDTSHDLEHIKKLICSYARNQELSLEIDCFSSGRKLLQITNPDDYQLVILDIYLGDMNGVELAKQLLAKADLSICFYSSCPDFALEAIRLNSIHYLIKPAKYEDVAEVFTRCLARTATVPSQQLSLRVNQQEISIPQDAITYIEKFDKVAVVHTKSTEFKTYLSLSVFEAQLNSDIFIRPHRSYIVNMYFIEQINTDKLLMKNGQRITLSRKNKNNIRNTYFDFLFTHTDHNTVL